MQKYYELKRKERDITATIKKWIDNKELHKHPKIIMENLYMIDCHQSDLPNQVSIAEEQAYIDHFRKQNNRLPTYRKRAKPETKELAENIISNWIEMDRNFPHGAINFLIKAELGKNIDDLIEGRYLRLDVEDVVYDIMNDTKLEKDYERASKK